MRARFSFLAVCCALALTASVRAQPMADFMREPAPENIVYATRDGQALLLHSFRPREVPPGERRPAIIWIHGGAWVGGTTDGFMPHARYFAARGLVAFNITYRLARPTGPIVADCVRDCRSALRYIRAHAAALGVDPQRIAVAGDSAGGHLAAALGLLPDFNHPDDDTRISGRPDAMLLYNPVLDLTEADWIRYAVGGPALADRKSPRPADTASLATARALSPVFHVTSDAPPALLLHGTADKIVPISQADRFAAAAQQAGVRCDYERLPDLGHAFVIAGYKWPEPVVVDAVRRADRFLVSLGWLRGEPTLAVSPQPAWTPLPR